MNKSDWKTKAAGILGALYGLSAFFVHVIVDPDPAWALTFDAAAPWILGGLGVFGLGAKLQKLIDALKK